MDHNHDTAGDSFGNPNGSGVDPAPMRDPVCGMDVAGDTPHRMTHQGVENLFCSAGCMEKYKADPSSYAGGGPAPTEKEPKPDQATSGTYSCPTHTEVRQEGPGSCPECGMSLDPEIVALPSSRTEYVCPMHPEIIRDEPGSCPICGMGLEPRVVTLDEEENPELLDMTRRFWVSAALSVPVLAIAMGGFFPGGIPSSGGSSPVRSGGRSWY